MIFSKCAICCSKKSKIIKKQEVKELLSNLDITLLSNLDITTLLSNSQYWVMFCFDYIK